MRLTAQPLQLLPPAAAVNDKKRLGSPHDTASSMAKETSPLKSRTV